jgi:alpha-tubulin suppressor-like RCC1 family protein
VLAQAQAVNLPSVQLFPGNFANYRVTRTANGFQVVDTVGSGGTVITSATKLQFADYSVSLDTSGTAAKVYRLYQAAFDRSPDLGGLGFHVSMIDGSGLDLTTVAQGFIDSVEFQQKYGNTDNKSFVTLLYTNILHRAPDSSGLNYWTDVLNANGATRAQVLSGFSDSNENVVAVNDRIQNGIAYIPYNTGGTGSALELGGGKIAWGQNATALVVLRDSRGIEVPAAHVTCASPDVQKLSISSDCRTIVARTLGTYNVAVRGDGVTASLPLKVIPPRRPLAITGVTSHYGSGDYNAVVTSTGNVLAWGANPSGVLGPNAASSSSLPLLVSTGSTGPLANIVSASTGYLNVMALTEDGTLQVWGNGSELGFTSKNSSIPDKVPASTGTGALSHIVQVATGDDNVAALTDEGTVFSWGYYTGQGTDDKKSLPGYVLDPAGKNPLTGIVSVSAGSHFTLALGGDGKVYGWGWYQTSRGNPAVAQSLPATVKLASDGSDLNNVAAISAGYNFGIALTRDGRVYAWGDNSDGQLGQNATGGTFAGAVLVKDMTGSNVLSGIVTISAGGRHALALDAKGQVLSWGLSSSGQLGDGANRPIRGASAKPIAVVGPTSTFRLGDIASIAGGFDHSLALAKDGTVYAWGAGLSGNLGQGGTASPDIAYPVPVKNTASTGNLSLGPLTGYSGLFGLGQ